MDDLISRKKAIEMLCAMRCSCKPEECGLTLEQDGAEECADVRWIMSLPSAQSEQSIEIQDILEYLDTVLHPIISPDHWSAYSELHDMVSMLSSAQHTGTWLVAKGACEPDYMQCNRCGWITEYYGGLEEEWNYCPHCGARMESE